MKNNDNIGGIILIGATKYGNNDEEWVEKSREQLKKSEILENNWEILENMIVKWWNKMEKCGNKSQRSVDNDKKL